jgi:phosphomevalonate kinase
MNPIKKKMSPFYNNTHYDDNDFINEYTQSIRYFNHENEHEHKNEWPFSPMLTTFMISTLFIIFYGYIVI